MSPSRILRRGVGAVVLVATVGLLLVGISRAAPRSPLTILVAVVLGILTMKLVEYRVRRWVRRWEEQEAKRTRPSDRRSPPS